MGQQSGSLNNRIFEQTNKGETLPKLDFITFNGTINSNKYLVDMEFYNKNMNDEIDENLIDLEIDSSLWKNPYHNCSERIVPILIKTKFDGRGYRRPIDIVFVLDKSGSMTSRIDGSSCIEIAKEAFISMVQEAIILGDRICLITIDNNATLILPLTSKEEINFSELYEKIKLITAGGGTDLCVGFELAYKQFTSESSREKRIIYSTDMNDIRDSKFEDWIKISATNEIFTTILAIGTELNVDFTERVSHNRGCNYLSALNKNDFYDIMIKDFKYNFFPVVHDLVIKVSSSDYEIVEAIGTDVTEKVQNDDDYWTKVNHRYESKDFKKTISLLRIVFKRKNIKLRNPVVANICNFLRSKDNLISKMYSFFSSKVSENKVTGGLILLRLKNIGNYTTSKAKFTINFTSVKNTIYRKEYLYDFNSSEFCEDSSYLVKKSLCIYSYCSFARSLLSKSYDLNSENFQKVKDFTYETITKYYDEHKENNYILEMDNLIKASEKLLKKSK